MGKGSIAILLRPIELKEQARMKSWFGTSVSIVNFEQVNVIWVRYNFTSDLLTESKTYCWMKQKVNSRKKNIL